MADLTKDWKEESETITSTEKEDILKGLKDKKAGKYKHNDLPGVIINWNGTSIESIAKK